jgi:hypothetical protein
MTCLHANENFPLPTVEELRRQSPRLMQPRTAVKLFVAPQ